MSMRAGVGFSDAADSYAAGQAVAREALARGALARCDVALLFSTAEHQPAALRDGVRSVIGPAARLVGGWSVGALTNERMGYGGTEVGLACLELDGGKVDVVRADGLAAAGEEAVGELLGRELACTPAMGDASHLLFWDSVNRTSGRMQLNMATPLLRGLRRHVPSLPRLAGAGLVGDMVGRPTFQWQGDEVAQQSAFLLSFSGGIGMHTTLVRGCTPASGYHVVTKADGPAILEIDGRPAVAVISELLGGQRDPSEFGFYVTLGMNLGDDPWADFDEDQYSNFLCLRVDARRQALIMFEPAFREGTQFQLMSRRHDLAYIGPQVEQLFAGLGDRRPVLALYINCAGRAGAYAGLDDEDALHVQRAIAGRVPLLGIYSGCEIGPIRGEAMPMDWTGVLCLFTA